MRHLKNIMILFMVLTVGTFTSCSSDDDGGDPGDTTAAAGTITAKIDGANFTSLQLTTFANLVNAGGVSTLTIQGNTDSQAFNLLINGYDGVGTYEISDAGIAIIASYIEPNITDPMNTQTWSAPYANSGVIGEINISEETANGVKGTFFFTGKNANDDSTKVITDGQFNVEFL